MARVALLVLGLTGCAFVVPTTVSTPVIVAQETKDIVPDNHPPMRVELTAKGRAISVRAAAPRMCTRETWVHREITNERQLDLEVVDGGGGGGGAAAVVLLAGTLVALPITAIVSGIVVATSTPWKTRDAQKTITNSFQCPIVAANVPVAVTLPSGAIVELATDANGNASFVVPATEPDDGQVLVHAGAFAPRAVRYGKHDERTACLQVRSQQMREAQMIGDIKERTRRLQTLPQCPQQPPPLRPAKQ